MQFWLSCESAWRSDVRIRVERNTNSCLVCSVCFVLLKGENHTHMMFSRQTDNHQVGFLPDTPYNMQSHKYAIIDRIVDFDYPRKIYFAWQTDWINDALSLNEAFKGIEFKCERFDCCSAFDWDSKTSFRCFPLFHPIQMILITAELFGALTTNSIQFEFPQKKPNWNHSVLGKAKQTDQKTI